MASFTPPNPPANLRLDNFYTTVTADGGPAKSCRFVVRILPATTNGLSNPSNILNTADYATLLQDLSYLCEQAEFPGRSFDFSDFRYYGPTFQMPYNSKYAGQTDFVFYCRTESYERQLFDDWLEYINPSNTFDFNFPDNYYAEIQVFQITDYKDSQTEQPAAMYAWTLNQAWPLAVNPQPVTWGDEDLLRLTVTFSYKHWSRPNRDTPPTPGIVTIST